MVDVPERQSKPRMPVVKVYPAQDAARYLGRYTLHVQGGAQKEMLYFITVEGKDVEVMPVGAGIRRGSYTLKHPEDVNEFRLRT